MAAVEVAPEISLARKVRGGAVEVADARLERNSWSAVAPLEVLTTSSFACGATAPMPTLPVKYALPVVVAPPLMVSPPACVPSPMVVEPNICALVPKKFVAVSAVEEAKVAVSLVPLKLRFVLLEVKWVPLKYGMELVIQVEVPIPP